jgi:hypothetical protein
MKFDVYTRQDGSYVLMPEGSTGKAGVVAMYGELEFCETIDPVDYPLPAIWDTVRNELERYDHVVLPESIGKRLLGLDCEDDHADQEPMRSTA